MNEELPPPNRAIGWYRFMLWVMPTCVALTSAFGIGWLAGLLRVRSGEPLVLIWLVFNIAAAIGVGIFDARLERSRKCGQAVQPESSKVLKFVMLQFLIVPVMSCVIAFGFCLVAQL